MFRFKLRTLFVLILLVAIGITLVPYVADLLPLLYERKETIVIPKPRIAPYEKPGRPVIPPRY